MRYRLYFASEQFRSATITKGSTLQRPSHAVKMESDRAFPQAGSAHDTFWDWASLMPESTHMLMWAMSDRAIPRSYRMMEGFGIHTFRLVNAKGKSTL